MLVTAPPVPRRGSARLRAVVAIPARDEEERLPACLEALGRQLDGRGMLLPRGSFGVVLLLNNCRDGSAAVARSAARRLPMPLRIVEHHLPPDLSHAGGARRLAMDVAAAWLDDENRHGLVLTTDADSRVDPSWITANVAAAAAGADAVAGRIRLDAADAARLPELLHSRGRLEAAYEAQLIEIAARLDPQPHNPWPHHATASGASLAVTLATYRRIGGLPALPFGEDRALVAALRADDARVRFAPDILVTTSGRLDGRAAGGAAETMRRRSEDPEAPCDEALEPVRTAVDRARWRGRLRRLHAEGRLADTAAEWALRLGLTPAAATSALRSLRFGALWFEIEQASPVLERRYLRPAELPAQISRAATVLSRLRRSRTPARDSLGPILAAETAERAGLLQSRVVATGEDQGQRSAPLLAEPSTQAAALVKARSGAGWRR